MLSDPKLPRNGASHLLARTSPFTAGAVLLATLLIGAVIGSSWQSSSDSGALSRVPVHEEPLAACEPAPPAVVEAAPVLECPEALEEPEATQAALAAALDGEGVVVRRNFDALLAGGSPLGGSVKKGGMLAADTWQHTSKNDSDAIPDMCRLGMCDPRMSDAAYDWVWDQVRGEGGGIVSRLPLGTVPPKAALCTMLFNPIYKVAFSRSTKVGGTSLTVSIGNFCRPNVGWERLKTAGFCFVTNKDMQRYGLPTLGYNSWEELWADYTVFSLVRNPYDRAGSSYDYMLGRHEDTTGHCAGPEFEQFCARPYLVGMQNLLFNCGDAIHDLYHVEPQAPCLVDGSGELAVDYIVRLENVSEDYAGLIAIINSRRAAGLEPLNDEIGWAMKGPLVKSGEKEANRHLAKFEACGAQCFDLVRNYYRDDFALLKYATTEPADDDADEVEAGA